ncbi:hypothetical protein A2U01_0041317, partial [Trifolium medium]|nr:hypothetical protein [Trifolium medium]
RKGQRSSDAFEDFKPMLDYDNLVLLGNYYRLGQRSICVLDQGHVDRLVQPPCHQTIHITITGSRVAEYSRYHPLLHNRVQPPLTTNSPYTTTYQQSYHPNLRSRDD